MSQDPQPTPNETTAPIDQDIFFTGRALPRSREEAAVFNAAELAEMEARDYMPREVHLQVSKRCNLQCVMCSWETWTDNKGLMQQALFEEVLRQCKAAGVRKLVFGNAQGEPFLHPGICDMIAGAAAEGFWTMVSTNGTPLTPARIAQLMKTGINHIQFSFAGYNAHTYETIYVGAKWEKVVAHLTCLADALAAAEAPPTLVVNGCYARELAEIVTPNSFIARTRAFLYGIGIGEPRHTVTIQLPHNFGGAVETGEVVGGIRSHFSVPDHRPGLCRVLKNAPGIYHDGRVTACGCLDPNGDLQIGDLADASFAEIRKGAAFRGLLKTFTEGDLGSLPLCAGCDVPYYERPEESPLLWRRLVMESTEGPMDSAARETAVCLETAYRGALERVVKAAVGRLHPADQDPAGISAALFRHVEYLSHLHLEAAHAVSRRLFHDFAEERIIEEAAQRPVRSIALIPATKIVLENLDWFQARYDRVLVGDRFKAGQEHFGQKVLTVEAVLAQAGRIDLFLLTTNTPDIEAAYVDLLPTDKTVTISQLCRPMHLHQFARGGLARATRILAEIEASENPLVVLGNKLLATAEPTFLALETVGFDVFVVSLYDKMENIERSAYDAACPVSRNVLVTPYEQLYILTHLKKGRFWIYYDFFYNVCWNATNALITYANAAAMLSLAARPVVMGMYDIIKPMCLNMDRAPEAFALYKVMLDQADAVALTSKSDHIAAYLRNTLVKDRPICSFYRYSLPPRVPLPRLSDADGERHLVGVTSFLGEVFEPNRVATADSIRTILRQKIHFHYYSDNHKVLAFRDALPSEERGYFHIEKAIWDQAALVTHMSRYDAGWLVGDEALLFARLIAAVEDRHIRELYTLFVPNGVPTSSMTYGAAGLPVFISRQIKVMDEVYPPGCCIPLDMGEVDNLANVFARLDWAEMHRTMRNERARFDIFHQIPRLAAFLREVEAQPTSSAPEHL